MGKPIYSPKSQPYTLNRQFYAWCENIGCRFLGGPIALHCPTRAGWRQEFRGVTTYSTDTANTICLYSSKNGFPWRPLWHSPWTSPFRVSFPFHPFLSTLFSLHFASIFFEIKKAMDGAVNLLLSCAVFVAQVFEWFSVCNLCPQYMAQSQPLSTSVHERLKSQYLFMWIQ